MDERAFSEVIQKIEFYDSFVVMNAVHFAKSRLLVLFFFFFCLFVWRNMLLYASHATLLIEFRVN
jgi:hypothetical protein